MHLGIPQAVVVSLATVFPFCAMNFILIHGYGRPRQQAQFKHVAKQEEDFLAQTLRSYTEYVHRTPSFLSRVWGP